MDTLVAVTKQVASSLAKDVYTNVVVPREFPEWF